MSTVIPERLPKRATRGEERVFELLHRLPDNCIAYYEPIVGERYPDFLLISPTKGVLTIEIKGWSANSLVEGDSHSIVIRDHDREVKRPHPVRQAREYMFQLMDFCRENLWCSPLLHPDGEHRGRFFFPFGHLAILSNITRLQLQRLDPRLSTIFRTEKVITRDELDEWSKYSEPHALLQKLGRFFDPTWTFPPMLESQINLLRSMIHPEIRLAVPDVLRPKAQPIAYESTSEAAMRLTEGSLANGMKYKSYRLGGTYSANSAAESPLSEPIPSLLSISEVNLKVLDLQQELTARSVGSGHRLIFGVAGSGKTVVLISRARLLAEVAQKKVLILCFNVTFCGVLAKSLEDVADRVTIRHFDGLASELGVTRRYRESHAKLGERLLQRLEETKIDPRYDVLLIDEAQDFDPSWFLCAMRLVRDPEEADLLIVGDGNQGIYGRRRTPWSSLGIRAKGRTTYLRKSYRSSREIIRFAAPFASTEAQEDDGVSPVAIDPAQATRSTGVLPILMRAINRQAEVENVAALIASLIGGRLADKALAAPLQPADIAVLIPAISEDLKASFYDLCSQLGQKKIQYLWLNKDRKARARVSEKGVKLQSIHSAKGLQYKAVIVLWTDLLPNGTWDETEDEQRMLLYVALSRAEDYLIVSYSGQSPFVTTLIDSGHAQLLGR
jgi:AAA domain/UvrD-like helicase C-terminal domain/Nuclease-related domain